MKQWFSRSQLLPWKDHVLGGPPAYQGTDSSFKVIQDFCSVRVRKQVAEARERQKTFFGDVTDDCTSTTETQILKFLNLNLKTRPAHVIKAINCTNYEGCTTTNYRVVLTMPE